MNITNDIITFDAADFDGLSGFAKKALALFVGERADFSVVFSEDLTAKVSMAKESIKRQTGEDPDVQSIISALAAADAAKRAEVQPLLDQLIGSFLPKPTTPTKPTP